MDLPNYSETQIKILEAYIDLSHEIGMESITLQKVANKSQLGFTTVRYHFGNQKSLNLTHAALFHVFSHGYQHIERVIQKYRANLKSNLVHAYIKANFHWLKIYPRHGGYLCYFYYLTTTKVAGGLDNQKFRELALQRIIALLNESIGRKHYDHPKNPLFAATQIHNLLAGAMINTIGDTTKTEFLKQEKLVLITIDQLLRGSKK